MLAARMELGAAGFVRERHQDQATELRLPGHDDARQRLEVLHRLVVVPLRRAGRQLLQPERRSLRMARIAARMLAAVREEDRLHFRSERLEIEPLGPGLRRRRLTLHGGTGADRQKEHGEEIGSSAHARFIYGPSAGVKYAPASPTLAQAAPGGYVCVALPSPSPSPPRSSRRPAPPRSASSRRIRRARPSA